MDLFELQSEPLPFFLVLLHPLTNGLCAQLLLFLQENAMNYDKGVLAEILEPIMGKGLIPADLETWKVRTRLPPL